MTDPLDVNISQIILDDELLRRLEIYVLIFRDKTDGLSIFVTDPLFKQPHKNLKITVTNLPFYFVSHRFSKENTRLND
jgi:hypothetical protein